MSGSFESVWWNARVHRLDLDLHTQPKEFLGNRVRTYVHSEGKIHCTRSSEENGTHDAASSRTVSPTHYQPSYSGTCTACEHALRVEFTHAYTHACMCACTHTPKCTSVRTCTHNHTHIHACTHIHTHTRMHTHIHIHTHTHKHTHTHTHANTWTRKAERQLKQQKAKEETDGKENVHDKLLRCQGRRSACLNRSTTDIPS